MLSSYIRKPSYQASIGKCCSIVAIICVKETHGSWVDTSSKSEPIKITHTHTHGGLLVWRWVGQTAASSQWDVSWGEHSEAASSQTNQGTDRNRNSPIFCFSFLHFIKQPGKQENVPIMSLTCLFHQQKIQFSYFLFSRSLWEYWTKKRYVDPGDFYI